MKVERAENASSFGAGGHTNSRQGHKDLVEGRGLGVVDSGRPILLQESAFLARRHELQDLRVVDDVKWHAPDAGGLTDLNLYGDSVIHLREGVRRNERDQRQRGWS